MKLVLFLSSLLLSTSLYAIEMYVSWDENLEKQVQIACYKRDGNKCELLCDHKSMCLYKEKVCRNCMSSSVFLTHLFKDLNLFYKADFEVDVFEIAELIESGNYATFNAQSLMNYNSGHGFNDERIKEQFKKLCPRERTRFPTIIFETEPLTKSIIRARYISCNDDSYDPKFYSVSKF